VQWFGSQHNGVLIALNKFGSLEYGNFQGWMLRKFFLLNYYQVYCISRYSLNIIFIRPTYNPSSRLAGKLSESTDQLTLSAGNLSSLEGQCLVL